MRVYLAMLVLLATGVGGAEDACLKQSSVTTAAKSTRAEFKCPAAVLTGLLTAASHQWQLVGNCTGKVRHNQLVMVSTVVKI